MCGDPSPETFGVSENARRPLAGDFRSVGKRAATLRRGLSECRKVCGEGSADILHVFQGLFRAHSRHIGLQIQRDKRLQLHLYAQFPAQAFGHDVV